MLPLTIATRRSRSPIVFRKLRAKLERLCETSVEQRRVDQSLTRKRQTERQFENVQNFTTAHVVLLGKSRNVDCIRIGNYLDLRCLV